VGDEHTRTLLEEFLTRTHKAVTIAKRVAIGDFVVDARIIEATADAAAWYGSDDPKLLIGRWISLLHHPEDATLGRTLSVARHYGIKVPTRYVSRIRQKIGRASCRERAARCEGTARAGDRRSSEDEADE